MKGMVKWVMAALLLMAQGASGATVSTNCAGFVGYTSYGSLTIRNSIYAPQADANAVNDGCTYYRYNESHTGTITLDKCYYTQTLGTAQGKQALSIGFPSDVDITVVPTGNATEYGASRITVYEGNPCIKYNGVVYAGSSDVVTFTFTHNYLGCTVTGFNLDKDSDATLEGDNTNGSPEGVVKFTNCLFAPKSVTMGIERTYARSRTNDGAHVQMYYSSCRTNFGDNQQFRAYSISGGDGVTVATTQSAENTYTVSGITTYESGMMYDGVLYARENQSMSLNLGYTSTVPQGSTFSGFGTTAGTLSGDSNPFTLTMGKGDAVINAIINGGDTGWTHGGDGLSSNTAYIISTSADWNEFVVKVNNGIYGFNTAYYKLADNISSITITTMVGTEGRRFKGHFDGNGKTLTVSYGSAQSPFSEDYCAPFRYIEGADIHNLTVDGTIYTNMQFAAGIAGNALNDNAITDCRSNVTIQSSKVGDGTHGGFVANCQNNTDGETTVTFTRCVFNGKLLGTNTDNCGGFVGWTEGNDWAGVKFVDCIFAPNELSVQSDGSATFSRGRYNNSDHITVENSYYTQHLGAMQGEMAYTSQPANATFVTMTIAGFTIYVKKALVTNVAATDITPTEATISWTGTDACSNYQVRYRVRQNPDTYSTSFDNGLPEGWTTFDNDNDEFGWTHEDGTKKGMAHSGYGSMYSASYINNYGALEPDNWLVSPQLTLGGTMKVWLKGQDGDEFREHFAIYLSTAGGSKSDFIDDASGNLKSGVVTLVPETETTNAYQEYTADLSAYNGQNQTGYIAIRHFNCNDQFYLVLDDFSLYDENAGGAWSSVPGDTPAGTTLTGLNDDTTYEYQVQYQFGGNTFYTPTATLSTLNADVAPTNLSATSITANTANISWKGFGDSYNLRYGKGGQAKVTLYVPSDIWQDDSGYQMLLDANHNTYGSVIPESGGLTNSGDASADTYANFEYKIPTNADGDLNTSYVVDGKNVTEVTITIPAGTYDWCITNPSPNDRVWIASENGNVGGRQNEFVFEAGKHYTFTVAFDDASENDCTNMTAVDDDALAPGDVTNVTGITSMSYALSDLTASTNYTVYVQSVKGDKTSEWSSVNFNTLNAGELYLYDDQDNSGIIAANNNQTLTVTLQSRTLYKDGDWNTLCLPFNVTLAGSPLAGGEARTLSSATLADGTLTLNFSEPVSSLTAGTPYIIKWGKPDGYDENPGNYDIVNPTFNSVSIISTEPTPVNFDGGSFVGQYSPFTINAGNIDKIIMLSTGNRLGYSKNPRTLRSFRCHFEVPTITGAPAMNSFVINFGEETSLREISNEELVIRNYDYYTLDGRKLQGKPTAKGVYIHNRHKVVVK